MIAALLALALMLCSCSTVAESRRAINYQTSPQMDIDIITSAP